MADDNISGADRAAQANSKRVAPGTVRKSRSALGGSRAKTIAGKQRALTQSGLTTRSPNTGKSTRLVRNQPAKRTLSQESRARQVRENAKTPAGKRRTSSIQRQVRRKAAKGRKKK